MMVLVPEVVVNGVTLAYDVEDPAAEEPEGASRPPVLLLPGLGEPRSSWSLSLRPALSAAGWRTIAVDLRGMPPSQAPPGPYEVDDYVADVVALIAALDAAPCLLVGYSLGGWIAERLAAIRPELVAGLALVASANDGCAWERLRYRLGAEMAALGDAEPALFELVSLLSYLPTPQLQDDATVDAWASILAGGVGFPNPGRLAQWQSAVSWADRADRDVDRARIGAPCLVLAFEHDWDCPPAMARAAADVIPGARCVELDGCGHLAMFERPDEVAAVLLGWLASVM